MHDKGNRLERLKPGLAWRGWIWAFLTRLDFAKLKARCIYQDYTGFPCLFCALKHPINRIRHTVLNGCFRLCAKLHWPSSILGITKGSSLWFRLARAWFKADSLIWWYFPLKAADLAAFRGCLNGGVRCETLLYMFHLDVKNPHPIGDLPRCHIEQAGGLGLNPTGLFQRGDDLFALVHAVRVEFRLGGGGKA